MNPLYFPWISKIQPIIRLLMLKTVQYDLSEQTKLVSQTITEEWKRNSTIHKYSYRIKIKPPLLQNKERLSCWFQYSSSPQSEDIDSCIKVLLKMILCTSSQCLNFMMQVYNRKCCYQFAVSTLYCYIYIQDLFLIDTSKVFKWQENKCLGIKGQMAIISWYIFVHIALAIKI